MGDYPRALEALQRAWKGRPDGEIGAHLGEVLWVSGDRTGAERIWQEATKNRAGKRGVAKNHQALQTLTRQRRPILIVMRSCGPLDFSRR